MSLKCLSSPATVLEPLDGYGVLNRREADLQLQIPPRETPVVATKATPSPEASSLAGSWGHAFKFDVAMNYSSDTGNEVTLVLSGVKDVPAGAAVTLVDYHRHRVASGVYFYRLETAGGCLKTKKLVLVQ